MPVSNFSRTSNGDITVRQGTTIEWAYAPKDATGQPINLAGWSARMQVRTSPDAKAAVLELSTDNGKVTVDGNQFKNKLAPVDTSSVRITGEALEGVYDYEIVDANGNVTLIDSGTFVIQREITRS
jgi:hypothetical protein